MPTDAENQVLTLLAKEWDNSGPPGILDISELVAALPLAPSVTLDTLKRLFGDGRIDMNRLKTSAFLTPEGYAAASSLPGTDSGTFRPLSPNNAKDKPND